jgi:hypothetical protein
LFMIGTNGFSPAPALGNPRRLVEDLAQER